MSRRPQLSLPGCGRRRWRVPGVDAHATLARGVVRLRLTSGGDAGRWRALRRGRRARHRERRQRWLARHSSGSAGRLDVIARRLRDAFDPHRILNRGILGDGARVTHGDRAPVASLAGTPLGDARVRARPLRPLRLLPPGLPDVPRAGGRERQPARPPDAHARRRRGRHRRRRPGAAHAHRPLPRLPGVRDGVPVRRALRPPARGDSRDDRERGTRSGAVASAVLATMASASLRGVAFGLARLARAPPPDESPRAPAGPRGICVRDARVHAPRRSRSTRYDRSHGDGSRGTVATLDGCVMDGLVRAHERGDEAGPGAERLPNPCPAPGQRCCGALHAHAGDQTRARDLARRNIAAFEQSGAEFIAVNAAGCGAMMKDYGHLLRDDSGVGRTRRSTFAARVRDVSELLARPGRCPAAACRLRVTYDAPCHLHHAQRVRTRHSPCFARFPDSTSCRCPTRTAAAAAPASTTSSSRRQSDAVLDPKLEIRRGDAAPCSSRPATRAATCRSAPG